MIAFEEHLISSIVCENIKSHLIFKRDFGRNSFNQNSIISMRLANFETLAVQVEANNIPICNINSKKINCEEMFKSNKLETNQCDRTLWKPPLWQSISAPPSPTAMPLQPAHVLKDRQKTIQLNPCLKSKNSKFEPPPLQPSQWNILKNEECNEGDQWLLNTLSSKRGVIGTNMKLDLDAIQRNKDFCERTELQQKRDKFAYFDKECSHILDHVYLGSEAVAKSRKTLQENGITHVLNCVGYVCPEYFPEDLSYKTLWLQDSPTEDITSILYDVFDYFEEVREEDGRVFVHCCQGVSRSTSLVIAYLMWVDKHTFEDAFQHVKAARGVSNPNMGFACQLLQCQKRMHAIPISPKSTLRMYRMAPHSPYDPMHLVPKKINSPHVAAFDSRGAFVVLTPNTLFIWQGLKCDTDMASAAHHFTNQVIQYEKAKGHILHILERQEPEEFWKAFKTKESHNNKFIISLKNVTNKNSLSTLEKNTQIISKPNLSLKKISLYDKDFETYMKAKHNKLMPTNINKGFNFIIQRPRDSGWTHLQRKYIDELEKLPSEACEDLYENILFEDERIKSLEKVELKNCKEIETISRSPSSPNASQCSSTSSLSFHSFLSNSSQSPPAITSPCLSPPAITSPCLSPPPTPIVSNKLSSNSLCILPSTIFHTDCLVRTTSISIPLPSNDKLDVQSKGSFSKYSSPLRSSKMSENNSAMVEPNLSIYIDEVASLPKTNPQISTISNENTMEWDLVALQTNKIRYKRDVSIKNFEQIPNVYILNERLDSSSEACCSFQKEEKGESSSSECKDKQQNDEFATPILFEWPQMEKVDMFDADDLDSDGAFVLLVLDDLNRSRACLYLWVGSSLQIESDQKSVVYNGDVEEQIIKHWQLIGKDLTHQLQLQKDTHVEIVFDGKEPNEFWDCFING